MVVDVTAELAQILDGTHISFTPDQIQSDIDGGGKVVVCKGDLPGGCSIRGARAIVIDGDIVGPINALSEMVGDETVIVLGSMTRGHVRSERIIVTGAVDRSLLFATYALEVGETLVNSQVQLGAQKEKLSGILGRQNAIEENLPQHNDLDQQVEIARRELNRLLQATGVVFNLNIGKIVSHDDDGLRIDLTTFYEAVDGRSEDLVDKALRQFFAKAVLGLLTRLNRDYIASGRGHQDRFKKVVKKLQDLVFKTREYDKFVNRYQSETAQIETLRQQYAITIPALVVQGATLPSVEVVFRGVEGDKTPSVQTYRLEIEEGRRKGTDEVRVFKGDALKDMVVVAQASFENVKIQVVGNQIRWEPRS